MGRNGPRRSGRSLVSKSRRSGTGAAAKRGLLGRNGSRRPGAGHSGSLAKRSLLGRTGSRRHLGRARKTPARFGKSTAPKRTGLRATGPGRFLPFAGHKTGRHAARTRTASRSRQGPVPRRSARRMGRFTRFLPLIGSGSSRRAGSRKFAAPKTRAKNRASSRGFPVRKSTGGKVTGRKSTARKASKTPVARKTRFGRLLSVTGHGVRKSSLLAGRKIRKSGRRQLLEHTRKIRSHIPKPVRTFATRSRKRVSRRIGKVTRWGGRATTRGFRRVTRKGGWGRTIAFGLFFGGGQYAYRKFQQHGWIGTKTAETAATPAAPGKAKRRGYSAPLRATAKRGTGPSATRPVPQPHKGRVNASHATKGAGTMSNGIEAAGEAAQQHIGGFEPENAADLENFLRQLPDYFDKVSGAFTGVADRLEGNYPLEGPVTERLREIGHNVQGLSDMAGEAHSIHRQAHETELQRIENPRPGEEFWDIRNQ